MKKTIIAVLLVLVMAVSFVACGGNGDDNGNGTDPGEKYKVYLITMDRMDNHWAAVDAGCQKAVAEIGADKIEYIWDAPENKDDNAQIEIINNAIANGANLILLAANSPDAQVGAIEAGAADGVKFIYVDSPADWDGALATIATDNKAAGAQAGEEMLAALEAEGLTEGSIGIVNVNPSTASTAQREEGFRSVFDDTEFEILTTQYGEGDPARSQELAANFITDGVVALFGCNEGSTVGVGNAIKEAGGGVIGVGFDTGSTVPDLIEEGILLCTMAQNPETMGYEGMMAAYTALTGGTIANPNINSGATVINKDNVDLIK